MSCLLAVAVLAAVACDRSPDRERPRGAAFELQIPRHDQTPRVELAFELPELETGGALGTHRRPLGNAVYLALRNCSEVHPSAADRRTIELTFSVEQGEVEGPSVPRAGPGASCLERRLAGHELSGSDGGGEAWSPGAVRVRATLFGGAAAGD